MRIKVCNLFSEERGRVLGFSFWIHVGAPHAVGNMVSLINELREAIANLFRLLSHRSVFDVVYVSAEQIESRSRGHCGHGLDC